MLEKDQAAVGARIGLAEPEDVTEVDGHLNRAANVEQPKRPRRQAGNGTGTDETLQPGKQCGSTMLLECEQPITEREDDRWDGLAGNFVGHQLQPPKQGCVWIIIRPTRLIAGLRGRPTHKVTPALLIDVAPTPRSP